MPHAKKKYLLYHPTTARHNGSKALYALHDKLRQKGYEAFFVRRDAELVPGCQYIDLDTINDDMRQHDIAVYPEVVDGNPWRFQNVARYVLYFPGQLNTGEKKFHPSEKVFTWNKKYYDAPELAFDLIDSALFFDEHLPKLQDCYFVHKRGKWREVKEVEGLVEINMDWPSDRKELAHLLQTTGTFYSFDEHSQLNAEAARCGATVKIVTETGFKNLPPGYGSVRPSLERELQNFIAITQRMNYTGTIQEYPMILENFLAAPQKPPQSPADYERLKQRLAVLRELEGLGKDRESS
jgi:hypothetical protein